MEPLLFEGKAKGDNTAALEPFSTIGRFTKSRSSRETTG